MTAPVDIRFGGYQPPASVHSQARLLPHAFGALVSYVV